MEFHRIFLAGAVGTGKTRIALTAPRGIMHLHNDRVGGNSELKNMEDLNIHTFTVNHANPRNSMMDKIALLRSKEIESLGIKTVIYDGPTFTQDQVKNIRAGGNLSTMTLRKYGDASKDLLDIWFSLSTLPVHLVVVAHMTPKEIKNGEVVIGKKWQHDIMPSVYKQISREASLMGYTWKKTVDGKTRFGTCFQEKLGNIEFADVKAPPGWGGNEPSNISEWIARLAAEEIERKKENRKAIIEGTMNQVEVAEKGGEE